MVHFSKLFVIPYFDLLDAGDFQEITAPNNILVPFTQDPSTHRQCFSVNITDDEFLEETEGFNLSLSLIESPTVPVEVQPPISEVEIKDDDCMITFVNYGRPVLTFLHILQLFLLDLREISPL